MNNEIIFYSRLSVSKSIYVSFGNNFLLFCGGPASCGGPGQLPSLPSLNPAPPPGCATNRARVQRLQKLVVMATFLGDRKLISDRLSTTTVADYSTNPQNLTKIGVADFEITGLTGIVKK